MSEVVAKLDDLGLAAWIGVMVLGFVVFFPAGLAILAYLIWSGRMACGWHRHSDGSSRWERKMQKFQDKMDRWQQRSGGSGSGPWQFAGGYQRSSGNRAFDEYREATMKRLEEEFSEFKSFLDRLREAKDKQEFEQFMNDRRNRPSGGDPSPGTAGGLTPSGGPSGSIPQQFRP